jgi:hypothetical protein
MKPLSDKQLAANRANAARSTGPRTPEGKARAALNSRKHGLAAVTFTASSIEDSPELEDLIADAVAFYRPQNSQEQFAVERIALCQLAILRAYRLEAGAMTSSFSAGIRASGEITFASAHIDQKNNHTLAAGFQRQANDGPAWSLILRYQAQADRQYRRAVEDFNRLAAQRPEIPNEPISAPETEQTEPDPPDPNEPMRAESADPHSPAPVPIQFPQPRAAESPAPTSAPLEPPPPGARPPLPPSPAC